MNTKIETDSKALDYRVFVHKNYSKNDFDKWVIDSLDLTEGMYVLDIGCGRGKHFFTIAQIIGENGLVVGMDASDESLSECRQKISRQSLKNMNVVNSDLTKLSENNPAGRYHRILSSFAIYYTIDKNKTFNDIHQLLETKGVIFICGPTKKNNTEFLELVKKAGGEFSDDFLHWTDFLETDAKELLSQIFGNVEVLEFSNPINFPDGEVLYNYWKATPLYSKDIEENMKKVISDHFRNNDSFVTNKVIIGLRSIKDE